MGRLSGTIPVDTAPGTVVYRMFSPQNAGVVTENKGRRGQCASLIIKWLDGSTSTELSANLRLLQSLIDDHRSKMEYSSRIRERAQALWPNGQRQPTQPTDRPD